MYAILSKTKALLKHSDSMFFKFLLVHSWLPEKKLLNRGVSSTHANRERRGEQSLSSTSMAVKAAKNERCYLVSQTN